MPELSWNVREQVVNRMLWQKRIASEANVPGKAGKYADGGTIVWKVEVSVGVNKS